LHEWKCKDEAEVPGNFFKHISTALSVFDALRDQTIRSMLIRPATPLPYPFWT